MLQHRHYLGLLLAAGQLLAGATAATAKPFVPANDAQVLERLRIKPADPVERELQSLRARLTQKPGDLPLALTLAKRYIERGRLDSDPRYNGYAQAALAPWWDAAQPPTDVLVMRATLKQSTHNFDGAIADLDAAIKADPRNSQAWVTRALIMQVRGEYKNAKRDCVPLLQLSTQLVGVTCLAGVASLNGQADRSYNLLERVLKGTPKASNDEKLWALTVMGETAHRRNQPTLAEKHFKSAMALGPDSYLLGAYADFLLDEKRPEAVIALLKDQTRADGLLLRLAIAEAAIGSPAYSGHRAALEARFAAGRARNDSVHRREEARFLLLIGQPGPALKLALENWAVQREPADARVLLEAALASRDPKAAAPALAFLEESRLEDSYIARLTKQLKV